MKSDLELQTDVLAEIAADVGAASSNIAVAARDGVVTLGGETDSLAKRLAVVRAASRVHGVRAVADSIFVRLPSEHRCTDLDLAEAVVSALMWDTEVPDKTIKARVQDQWIWLVGEADYQYQRTAAENAVRNIVGVKGVTNLVRLRKHATGPELKGGIERALARNAILARHEIDVAVNEGTATLTGTVGTLRERMHAGEVAGTPLGVRDVENLLELEP